MGMKERRHTTATPHQLPNGDSFPSRGRLINVIIFYKRKRKDLIMDRVELKKFLDKEQAAACSWYENARKAVLESEHILNEMKDYFASKGKVNISEEELDQFDDAKALVREAREELIFFDGVKKATDAIANRIRGNMAREELANAGKWVTNPIKPRRR